MHFQLVIKSECLEKLGQFIWDAPVDTMPVGL